MKDLSGSCRIVQGIPPVADFAPGAATYTDIINCKNAGWITFIILRGVADDAAIHTVTAEGCDTTSPGTATAVPFNYRQISAADAEGALGQATSAGFSSTSATNSIDIIEVDPAELAKLGFSYCRLKLNETHDHAVLGGVLVLLSQVRFAGDSKASVIV